MFESLSDKLDITFKKLRGQARLTEDNVKDALREVRLTLLEADVNFLVVKQFVKAIRERSMGSEVLESLTPAQQFIKIVNEEMVALMGGSAVGLDLAAAPPIVVMMVGLQGSGKTTSSGKLALSLKKQKRKPLLVPVDVYRPAAIDQLQSLGRQIDVPVFPSETTQNPVKISREALKMAQQQGYDTVIIDTAGRLQIDEKLMAELEKIKSAVNPHEILLVADAMTGQEAVSIAKTFDETLDISGVVLTKLDGDARGGAALSIKAVTGKPIKFVGEGEKLSALDVFHPERMASRILGMGDMLTLIEKAQESVDQKKAEELALRLRKNQFSLEDFRSQLRNLKKMGSIGGIMKMIPGMGKLKDKLGDEAIDDSKLGKIEAIINSMTDKERHDHRLINGSRRKRIAKGSGTTVQDVNRLLKEFLEMKKMMKKFNKMGPKGMKRMMGQLGM
ncbi:MAG: signal recognition particle protein [Deltaproteobacteria bacterium]|nr:MAG: signal recognition particle protein [Deltaproteobacteria bacterium]